ncbi:MAG: carbohydrate kinase family protein [Candidatus Latescibacterota bacterium]|jgi:sugar/nucleoside kinase (ribokinase family)
MAAVGCGGVLVADTFCGPMQELPSEGQLLVVETMLPGAGGCAANTAIDLARQGISVDVVGCLGRDASARIVIEGLEAGGVNCSQIVQVADEPTSKTVILIVEGQDRRYIHTFGANRAFTVGHVQRSWVAGLQVFYVGGFLLLPSFRTEEFAELLRFCRSHGVVTVVDVVTPPQVRGMAGLAPLLPLIDYFLPNDDEARALTGQEDPTDQLRFLLDAGANAVVVTCGEAGSLAASRNEAWSASACPMEVVDPSGSGDAFSSGLIAGLLRGWDLPRTLQYASAVGGSAVRAVGTTPGVFTEAEAEAFLTAHPVAVQPLSLH